MPYLTDAVQGRGPVVGLTVGVSAAHERALRAAHLAVPALVSLSGLIDSGADNTVVDVRQLQGLQLPSPSMAIVGIPAGGYLFAPQYEVGLTVLHPSGIRRNHLVIPALAVVDMPLASYLGYHVLIGRDVLRQCFWMYDGQAGAFTLGY
jgi:hypothetical protein